MVDLRVDPHGVGRGVRVPDREFLPEMLLPGSD
jgi:hypothetical protein